MAALALVLLILVPCYLVLNQFWKSLIMLAMVYTVMGLVFLSLGRHMRRVTRRLPSEIPPWQTAESRMGTVQKRYMYASAAETIRNACKDPQYLQNVLKPRLKKLLVYQVSGSFDTALETLDPVQLAHIDPAVFDFLQRQEATGLWARYRHRRQRELNLLTALRHIEAL
jgi:hypothetical protein